MCSSDLNPKKYLSLANPLTEERVYLRQSLLPSLQETWQQAASRGRQHTRGVFELAKVYLPQLADKVSEPMVGEAPKHIVQGSTIARGEDEQPLLNRRVGLVTGELLHDDV